MLNKYPQWKYCLLSLSLIVCMIYAAPNLFGESPAVQVLPQTGYSLDAHQETSVKTALEQAKLPYRSISKQDKTLLIQFDDTATQMKARDLIKEQMGEHFITALNLAPLTPHWLAFLGAKPMKLGLDLRGGVHFLMQVDVNSALVRRIEGIMGDLRSELRNQKIRGRIARSDDTSITIAFEDKESLDKAIPVLKNTLHEFDVKHSEEAGKWQILATMKPSSVNEIKNYTIEQTITTLHNRVNELGVAEAVVQRQGMDHIVVELPGIQDTARAKDILGKTATLEFHLHAKEATANATPGKAPPPGTKWYTDREGRPYLLNKRVVLTGESITGANIGTEESTGEPAVHVRVGGQGLTLFKKITTENIGNLLAVVYIETKPVQEIKDGKIINTHRTDESLISIANIRSALGSQFQITGFTLQEAENLALLLRAGALPATVTIVEERTVGPSLGQENIQMGVISIIVGMSLVLLAMLIYYRTFGLIADIALMINVVLLIAILSLIGATLTLPGMAGIVLTVGMAVDANVLIFERIREELRTGMSPQMAIHSGFERAFATIVDANVTTLIVGVILFSLGSGPVKGFAVTLCIGILTSMITAITGTRAMVNLLFGGRPLQRLSIGI